jgi:hypothetical protein
MTDKIKPHHLQRKAVLYVRQSSAHQVIHNRENSSLQYAMRERLAVLGWSDMGEVVVDMSWFNDKLLHVVNHRFGQPMVNGRAPGGADGRLSARGAPGAGEGRWNAGCGVLAPMMNGTPCGALG